MSLLLPTRWQKQPQGPVEIDWSHPLSKNLTGFWILNTALPVNLVDGVKSSFSTKPSEAVRRQGKVVTAPFVTNKTSSQLFDLNNAIGTIAHGYNTNDSSYTGGNAFGVGSRLNTTLFTDSIAIFRHGIFDFGQRLNLSATETIGDHFIALSSGHDGLLRAYKDNYILGSASKVASVVSQTTNSFSFGQYDATVSGISLAGYYLATWKRSLSPTEIAQFRRNPYALLKPVSPIRGIDLSIFNIDLDADLTGPAPLLEANFEQLEAGTIAINASLPSPAPSLTADIDTGKAISASLAALAPQLDGFFGQFTAANAALRLSSPTLQASFIGGTVINASLAGPSASISGEIVHGVAAQADLSAPAPTLQASIAPQVELPAPAAQLNASFVMGIVANGTLTAPAPRLNAALSDDRILRAELPAPAPSITGSFVFNQVINADLSAPAARIRANMHMGLAIQAVLTSPAPKLDAEFGSNAIIAANLPGPAPRLQANFTMPKPAATFYNRWTR